jgi:putative spermidine/putrescine transport system permease protein
MATSRNGPPVTTIAAGIYVAAVCIFLVVPLLIVVPLSFSSGTMLVLPVPGYSTRWYEEIFASNTWLLAFRNSIVIGVSATALATVLGTLAAMGTAKASLRIVRLMTAVALVPLIMPVVVVAVAMFYAFARIGLTQSYIGIVLAHTALGVPFVFVMVTSALKSLDPTLPRAGLALGGSPWHVFRTVTLPLIAPGVTTGALFAFATSFD